MIASKYLTTYSTTTTVIRVCVLHIKPFLLPVDMQRNQYPCRFFNPRRDASYMVAKLRHRDTTLPRMYAVSTAVGNAIPCHHILDTTGTTYTFYKIEERKYIRIDIYTTTSKMVPGM